ncbi:MAG: hypothetical protein ABGZ17_06830, partial [Planctomycetaceae bacterium]
VLSTDVAGGLNDAASVAAELVTQIDTALAPGVDASVAGSTLNLLSLTAAFTTSAFKALPAFTVTAFDGAAHSITADVEVPVEIVANVAPTLTTIAILDNTNTTGSPTLPTEDTELTITYADLLAASNLQDVNPGDSLRFRIESVEAGTTLTKNSAPVTPQVTTLGVGESVVWKAGLNEFGLKNAFKVIGYDGALFSTPPEVQVQVNLAALNDAPVLTSNLTFGSTFTDSTLTISHTDIVTAAGVNLSDADDANSSLSFRIVNQFVGTFSTTTIAPGQSLVWTSAPNLKGNVQAFRIVAVDPAGLLSDPPVIVNITVDDSPPTLTNINTLTGGTEDVAFTVTHAMIRAASDANDLNSDLLEFRIESLPTQGTLSQSVGGAAISVGDVITDTGATSSVVFEPALNLNGDIPAFTVFAFAGGLESATPVQVTINFAAINDAPTLSDIPAKTNVTPKGTITISYDDLVLNSDLHDVDLPADTLSFRVTGLMAGTSLTLNGNAVETRNETPPIIEGTLISAGQSVVWTPSLASTSPLTVTIDNAPGGGLVQQNTVLLSEPEVVG